MWPNILELLLKQKVKLKLLERSAAFVTRLTLNKLFVSDLTYEGYSMLL